MRISILKELNHDWKFGIIDLFIGWRWEQALGLCHRQPPGGQLTGFRPNSDSNSNNNYSIFIFPVCLCTLSAPMVIFIHLSLVSCCSEMLCSSTFISTIASIRLQSNLSTCHVSTLGFLSHCSLSLWKLLHFSGSFPVISYFLVNFRELSMNPSMIQQDCQDECCQSW